MNIVKNKNFEVEINGLRGIAIALVVLFHFEIYPFSGGFVGVDIFFVISGYLIGKIIEKKPITFINYKEYLLNRIRRIFPGLLVLILISFFFFAFLLSPEHFISFSKSVIYNLLLLPNLYFWTQSNYFDISSYFKPLLHTWSLGVEYHFYIIWPLIVWFISSLFKRLLFKNLFLVCFIIISISLNYYVISFGPVFENKLLYGKYVSDTIFFLSPFRIFEFAFGYILSINKKRIKSLLFNEILFLLGIILIFYSAVVFDKNTLFPGLNSIIPTLGAVFLIFSKNSYSSNLILKNKIINFLGTISFSLYLYHWPVLIYYKYYKYFEISLLEKIICIFVSILCGYLSFYYVEKFYLNKKINIFNKFTISGVVILLFFSFNVIQTDGWKFRLSKFEKNILENVNNKPGGVCNKDKEEIEKNLNCTFGDEKNLDLLLIGDSHSKALYDGFKTFAKKYTKNIMTLEDMCSVYPNISFNKNINIADCNVDINVPKTLIISKKFYNYQMPSENLETIAKNYISEILKIKNNKKFKNVEKIIIIGQVPEFYSSYGDLISCYTRPYYIDKSACDIFFNDQIFNKKKDLFQTSQGFLDKRKLNNFLNSNINLINNNDVKLYFFDPFKYLCGGSKCIQVKNGNLVYSDATHLSVYGANFLIDKIEFDLLSIMGN